MLKPEIIILLRRVAAHIKEEPRRFNMTAWKQFAAPGVRVKVTAERTGEVSYSKPIWHTLRKNEVPPCGTVACISGWASMLTGRNHYDTSWATGMGPNAFDRLCYVSEWPETFRTRYVAAKRSRDRVRVAVARIEHFIATGGKE